MDSFCVKQHLTFLHDDFTHNKSLFFFYFLKKWEFWCFRAQSRMYSRGRQSHEVGKKGSIACYYDEPTNHKADGENNGH